MRRLAFTFLFPFCSRIRAPSNLAVPGGRAVLTLLYADPARAVVMSPGSHFSARAWDGCQAILESGVQATVGIGPGWTWSRLEYTAGTARSVLCQIGVDARSGDEALERAMRPA